MTQKLTPAEKAGKNLKNLIKKSVYKTATKIGSHGKKTSIQIKLPKFTCLYFKKIK